MKIYDLLNKIIINKSYNLSSDLFTEEDRNILDDEDKYIFDLLKNISSLGIRISNNEIEFHPLFVMSDGRRTFSVEDISENDYFELSNLEFDKIPLILRALISDILWIKKRNFNAAQIAANTYWELFNLWDKDDNNISTLDMMRRAVCISIETKQILLYEEIQLWVKNYVENNNRNNSGFFLLRLIEVFIEQKNFDVSIFLDNLDSLIDCNKNNITKLEQAYKLKTKCLIKLKRKNEVIKNNILLAKSYLDFGEKIFKNDVNMSLEAADYYKKGILLYRNNGEVEKAENAFKRLVDIQKEIPKIMIPLSIKMDIKSIIENLESIMNGLTFEESIIRLTQIFVFEKREDIKNRVIKNNKKSLTECLFRKNLINEHGQTIFSLPPLDINNPEEDLELLKLHMYRNASENQEFVGDTIFKTALDMIRKNHHISRSKLSFLVKRNSIIPKGREEIFLSALYMFLNGNYYEAIHILAPQLENLFRNIAQYTEGLTVTLENDGTSKEKVLSSIFSLPELLDCYDNDILFTFRGLLNEQAGSNIRNRIAHGIISEDECSKGVCLYFGVAVIKLLSLTSIPYYKILGKSEKLHHFEVPNKDC